MRTANALRIGATAFRAGLISDVTLLHRAAQAVCMVGELYSVLFHHVAGSADGSGTVIPMFDYRKSGTGYCEASRGGDVEGILAVPSGSHNVYWGKLTQIYRDPHFKQCVTKSAKFLYRDVTHQEDGDQRGHLCIIVFALCNVLQYGAGFVATQILMFE